MKVYTKTGDSGKTSLINGTRVAKYHPQIEAYGKADLLNSHIGVLVCELKDIENLRFELIDFLLEAQKMMFNIGAGLASSNKKEIEKFLKLSLEDVTSLEQKIDEMDSCLPPLKNFVLPGGSKASSFSHICRCATRDLERLVWSLENDDYLLICQYLNRLSDFFFVLARFLNLEQNQAEILWT